MSAANPPTNTCTTCCDQLVAGVIGTTADTADACPECGDSVFSVQPGKYGNKHWAIKKLGYYLRNEYMTHRRMAVLISLWRQDAGAEPYDAQRGKAEDVG